MYRNSLNKLYNLSLFNSNKDGLKNMIKINSILNNPLQNIPIIHIAGTNGKGSVSVKLADCCSISGLKTGLFISPHISSFRERIQIDGNLISENDTTESLTKIFDICENNSIPATFFEIVTASAFLHFQKSNCDVIVLECGLGGRLDSTNIITPILSIITSIQFDHMNILGSTLEEIAMEKAGIMKPGVNVVIGPDCPVNLLKNEAKRVGSPFHHVEFSPKFNSYQSSKNITYDAESVNREIAKYSLQLLRGMKDHIPKFEKLDSKLVENGLKAKLPCRFEHFTCNLSFNNNRENNNENNNNKDDSKDQDKEIKKKSISMILDMAHNEGGIQALVWKLKRYYPTKKFRFIIGMSQRPDILNCLLPLFQLVNSNQIHCIEANHHRAVPILELKKYLLECEEKIQQNNQHQKLEQKEFNSIDLVNQQTNDNIEENIKICEFELNFNKEITDNHLKKLHTILTESLKLALNDNEILVICGTAFIMSDVRYLLGIIDSRDNI